MRRAPSREIQAVLLSVPGATAIPEWKHFPSERTGPNARPDDCRISCSPYLQA